MAMTRSLEISAIAEGVETPEQLAFLRALGCKGAQGYLFSRPVVAADCEVLLRDWDAGNVAWGAVDAPNEFGATWSNAAAFYPGEGTDVPWETPGEI